MIKVTVELWPGGSKENKRLLGELNIANVGPIEGDRHHYEAWIEGHSADAVELAHERSQSVWLLIWEALEALDAVDSLPEEWKPS